MSGAILLSMLLLFASRILFACEGMLCKIIDILYNAFEVFAGIKTVQYNGSPDYMLEVFFSNPVVSTVYWGMACIGFALMFGFAIVAVVRKLFDYTGEKVKATYTQIFINCFKSILLILLMTAIVSATINASGVLMRSIDTLFNSAEVMSNPPDISFDDEDRYDMYQVLDTIADYSLSPSYDSRFNINSCFNAIRPGMQKLDKTNIFKFSYTGVNGENGERDNDSWQYALLQIYKAASVYEELDIDTYNEPLNKAILDCMYQLKTNKDFKPLSYYIEPEKAGMSFGTTLGRTIMLTCSFGCANNSKFDENPAITDSLRYPYYVGEKDVFSYSSMEDDFDLGLFSWNHIVCLIIAYFIIKEMLIIIINSVARIFNIILLYITAPGFLAVMPLDDGGKFKQWTTAYVIQSLSLFGSVFAVRLLMIFIPIVLGSNLVLFEDSFANGIAKLAFVIGICVTSEKANGMISGILADNAGYQSIMAGDVGGGFASSAMALGGKVLGAAAKTGFKIGKGVLGAVGDASGLTTATEALKEKTGFNKLKNLGQSMRDKGGIVGAFKSGLSTNAIEKANSDKAKQEADAKDTKDFRSGVLGALANMAGLGGQFNGQGGQGGGGNFGSGNFGSGNFGSGSFGGDGNQNENQDENKEPGVMDTIKEGVSEIGKGAINMMTAGEVNMPPSQEQPKEKPKEKKGDGKTPPKINIPNMNNLGNLGNIGNKK